MNRRIVITFVSNYINHHQLPFCDAMNEIDDVEFHFVQTMPMEEKRLQMGWGVDPLNYPYVSLWYEERAKCEKYILDSDVTILGWSEGLISDIEEKRLSSGKLTFRVSERIYREGQWKFISPKGLVNKYKEHIRYRNKPVYLLCAGAYVASDFSLIHSYPGKMLKWGYFPVCETDVIKKDLPEKIRICWAGRLIDLKHPEFAIEAARVLKEKGYEFSVDIIGDGSRRGYIEDLVRKYNLRDEVALRGNLTPQKVREYMKEADIFLFTSNYLEGWGAVVNEAMGCGLCVVASNEAGAVPFLIKDMENGLTYNNGSLEDFLGKVMYLFESRDKIRTFGERALTTIKDMWNADAAAGEFVRFSKEYLDGKEPSKALEGPMSKAKVIRAQGFMRTMKERNVLE